MNQEIQNFNAIKNNIDILNKEKWLILIFFYLYQCLSCILPV